MEAELKPDELRALLAMADRVTHDLNNLLQPILGYADLLADELAPGDPRSAWVSEICRAARQAREHLSALREALRVRSARPGG